MWNVRNHFFSDDNSFVLLILYTRRCNVYFNRKRFFFLCVSNVHVLDILDLNLNFNQIYTIIENRYKLFFQKHTNKQRIDYEFLTENIILNLV